jgi:cytochrome c-type biogenesis protein CcmH/NrfF
LPAWVVPLVLLLLAGAGAATYLLRRHRADHRTGQRADHGAGHGAGP